MAGMAIPGLQDWLLTLNFGWAQELCIIMFVWMAKFGAAYGVRTGIHVGVDVLINRLDDGMRGKFIVSACWRAPCLPVSSLRWGRISSGKTGALRHFQMLGIDTGDNYEGRRRLTSSGRPGWCTAPFRLVPH